jgi:S-adenosylmethionine synthetase
MKKFITSECVGHGHPDKIADQISDAILDLYLGEDPNARVAVEAMVKDNYVILGGEVTTSGIVSLDRIHKRIANIYESLNFNDSHGLDKDKLIVDIHLSKRSPEINGGVDGGETLGAGDQGFMTGYATNETSTYMPLGMYFARKIVNDVTIIDGLGPDVKSQVTMLYKDCSARIHTILVSTMHDPSIKLADVREMVTKSLMKYKDEPVISGNLTLLDDDTNIFVNPAGNWNIGGPVSDCGLTGRKIVVDQYGPYCSVGGGAYSGKDSTKVDRSGSYLCRYIAKNLVAAGVYDKCKVEIAYMIGVDKPVGINIEGAFPNGVYGGIRDKDIASIKQIFPMTPQEIIDHFDLTKPIFYNTARYGHYGIDTYPWEQLDKVDELKELFSK